MQNRLYGNCAFFLLKCVSYDVCGEIHSKKQVCRVFKITPKHTPPLLWTFECMSKKKKKDPLAEKDNRKKTKISIRFAVCFDLALYACACLFTGHFF